MINCVSNVAVLSKKVTLNYGFTSDRQCVVSVIKYRFCKFSFVYTAERILELGHEIYISNGLKSIALLNTKSHPSLNFTTIYYK